MLRGLPARRPPKVEDRVDEALETDEATSHNRVNGKGRRLVFAA